MRIRTPPPEGTPLPGGISAAELEVYGSMEAVLRSRAMAVWRYHVGCLFTWLMTNPEEYCRDLDRRRVKRGLQLASEGTRLQTMESIEKLQAEIMVYARPGQGRLGLCLEILAEWPSGLFGELSSSGWLPPRPGWRSPRRSAGISESQRMANADWLASEMGRP